MVAEGDGGEPALLPHPLEPAAAQGPGPGLDAAPPAEPDRVGAEEVERDPHPSGQRLAESRVFGRVGPQAVVDVGNLEDGPLPGRRLPQQVQQADGVQASGERHQQPSARQPGALHGVPHPGDD